MVTDPADVVPRIRVTREGPILVEGPVELVHEDGSMTRSERVMVAICACRRSKRYPYCDTSHRRRVRTDTPRYGRPVDDTAEQ